MVTVELAVGVVTATLLAAALAGVVLLGVVQAACQRTSSEMARQLARGDGTASHAAELQGPQGARSEVDRDAQGVEVRVSAVVQVFGIAPLTVSAHNWAAWEPGMGDEQHR
ncbi:TadE family type IV pilus minor pilin [Tessaracoccus antarcticus]|uniref:TadE family type IV pilus minor pilin n=1 Tax=Tessaracoccus antarcticus TaxID=2479848 RepID=UPI0013146AB2|nr:TadE family type IV pilus minor pilin [Tessaracoccus antarcticus]